MVYWYTQQKTVCTPDFFKKLIESLKFVFPQTLGGAIVLPSVPSLEDFFGRDRRSLLGVFFPSPMKNMLVNMGIFPKFRGENKKKTWNHHLEKCWGKLLLEHDFRIRNMFIPSSPVPKRNCRLSTLACQSKGSVNLWNLATLLDQTSIAGWKIQHFNDIYQKRWENFHSYVSFPRGYTIFFCWFITDNHWTLNRKKWHAHPGHLHI